MTDEFSKLEILLEKAGKLEELNGDKADAEEVAQGFATILDLIAKFKDAVENRVEKLGSDADAQDRQIRTELLNKLSNLENTVSKRLQSYRKELSQIEKNVLSKIPPLQDVTDLEKRIGDMENKEELDLQSELPKYGTDIRNALELLPEGEKLSIEAIEGLQRILKRLELSRQPVFVGGSGNAGRVVRSYDISSLLDGNTKTFTLPAAQRVISVHSSSFPNAFRENVDFTWTSTSITFTSEIDASTTLAAGQTITVIYSEQ